MNEGRPADNHYVTQFYPFDQSLNEFSGQQYWSSQFKNGILQGKGKVWFKNGNVFYGDLYSNRMANGTLYELQSNKTYTAFDVKYNYRQDVE